MSSISVAGDSSGSITIAAPAVAGSGTLTLPVATDTLAGIAATQTLTNKTLGTGTVFPAGAVLQVVNATFGTVFTTNSSTYIDCGLTASITPKFATSKILVLVDLCGVSKATGNTAFNAKLVRNSTDILQFEGIAGFTGTTTDNNIGSVSTNYLDSPATTSATTYKIQIQSGANIAVVRINNTYILGSTSTITLMEIAV